MDKFKDNVAPGKIVQKGIKKAYSPQADLPAITNPIKVKIPRIKNTKRDTRTLELSPVFWA